MRQRDGVDGGHAWSAAPRWSDVPNATRCPDIAGSGYSAYLNETTYLMRLKTQEPPRDQNGPTRPTSLRII